MIMVRRGILLVAIGAAALLLVACSKAVVPEQEPWYLHNMVAPVQKSVVTVAVLDMEGNVLRIGSGFFIDRDGTLVTNDHVLDGAYRAEIKTADGDIFPIDSVIARNPLVDLLKVRVRIPRERACRKTCI
jgi:S1-C subfamily serine protease